MRNRLLFGIGAFWLALCVGLLLLFVHVTSQLYAGWVAEAPTDIMTAWGWYHLNDFRFRALAVAVVAALPGILTMNAAKCRDSVRRTKRNGSQATRHRLRVHPRDHCRNSAGGAGGTLKETTGESQIV